MAHWPRVRLTTLPRGEGHFFSLRPSNKGGIHGLQSRRSGVGSDGERKFRKREKKSKEKKYLGVP